MKNLYTGVFYLRLFSKNFFTFLIFHFGYFSGNYLLAQATDWKFQNPSPTANNIIDVHFVSEQNGWAVGDAGTILFTTNSGQNWGVQSSNTANSLGSVQFSNEQTGWIVGANGYILKTNNAGFTWLPQLSNTIYGLNDIFMLDGQNGWVVGDFGIIRRTTDGGNNWNTQTSGTSEVLNAVHFVDAQNGWASGQSGVVLKTTNGGTAWTLLPSVTQFSITDIHFADAQKGWAVAINGLILRTVDGGNSWTQNTTGIGGIADGKYAIQFNDLLNGWITGPMGIIRRTTNGGTAWTSQASSTTRDLFSVHFIDGLDGWSVGRYGIILKTTNGGVLWSSQNKNLTFNGLLSVYFHDSQKGCAVGRNGRIVTTGNGGFSWTAQNSPTNRTLRRVFFYNIQTGWAVGDTGTIIKTNDGGTSWQKLESGVNDSLVAVRFTSLQSGWAVGASGRILHTTNGGTTWQSQVSNAQFAFSDVFFVNSETGWIVGEYGLLRKTTDGGTTWLVQNNPTLNFVKSFHFISTLVGWAAGNGMIFKTIDGGASWLGQNVSPVSFNSIYFVDAQNGWTVGDYGIVFKTSNGGQNWVAMSSGTSTGLNSVHFENNQVGWAVGELGTIITTLTNNMLDPNAETSLAKGRIFEKVGTDCTPSAISIPGVIISANPGPYYGMSQSNGEYGLRLPIEGATNNYLVQAVLPTNLGFQSEVICPSSNQHSVSFGASPDTVEGKNFGLKITDCHHLDIQIASNRRRRCFLNNTGIFYSNKGSLAAPNAYILVEFPRWVRPVSCGTPHTAISDTVWRFELGNIQPGSFGAINISDSVICGNLDIIGLMQCTKATIYPAPDCPPPAGWNGAEVSVSGICNDGFVNLGIYNKTNADMMDSVDYWVYLDSFLVKTAKVKLLANDSLKLFVQADGYSVHLTANQVQNHPTELFVSTTVSNCKDTTVFIPRSMVNHFPKQSVPSSKQHCVRILGAVDPNDKQVFPIGFTSQKIIPPNTRLEYLVRFQNTGNDTAFTVFIIDTLDQNLNPASFEMGASSHANTVSIQTTKSGKTFLRWQFNNILLPDSNVNEPKSNGFVQFRISPKSGLALGTQARNHAEIYFDFNPPVITNQTLTTYDNITFTNPALNESVKVVTSVQKNTTPREIGVNLYPNPVTGKSLTAEFAEKGSFTLYSAQGQLIFEKQNLEGKQVIPIQLKTGFYLAQLKTAKGISVIKVVVE